MDFRDNHLILAWDVTVPTTTSAVVYTGDGTTATFVYTWRIAQDADLIVFTLSSTGTTITSLALTTDYTVTGAGVYTGGNVILTAGNLANGTRLFIASDPEQVQELLLQQGAAFNPADLMNALDLLTREVQATRRVADNSISIPVAESLDGYTTGLPSGPDRANKFVIFDADGNVTVEDISSISGSLVAGNYILNAFASGSDFTPGVTSSLTLSQAPGSINNTAIFFDGVYQAKNAYGLAGAVVTFTSPIPLGVARVEVTQAGALTINAPADNSVRTASIQSGAVTNDKLADGSVDSRVLGASSVTATAVAAGAIDASKLAADVVMVPIGFVGEFAGSTAPSARWLLCDGSAVSRTTYATLFTAIGTNWGVGDGSTTFNVPDKRGRTGIGAGTGSGLSARTLGQTLGEETHVLTTAELAAHTHTATAWAGTSMQGGGAPSGTNGGTYQDNTHSTGSAGSNTAHNNMQPSAVFNYYIRAL